ncbi:hypothetical protein MMC26_006852 [Xylographa opegraphella]|nr:hypothetical protein [Xylographa opegraphella]
MVNIKHVRSSNASLAAKAPGMVALFIGGTSGSGMGTLKQLARHAKAPKVYIVGRSQHSATLLLDELKSLNPQGTFIFLETEISLIRNVDQICREISSQEKQMDLIVLSTGYLTFAGRQETDEGIDTLAALSYYIRLRTVHNLLPLLHASPSARVISILAGGKESAIDLTDLENRKKHSLTAAAVTSTTQNTLAFEWLAQAHPTITFAHVYPGFVATGQMERFMRTAPGFWAWPAWVAQKTLVPLLYLFAQTPDAVGERLLFIATSARYPPAEPGGEGFMAAMPKGVAVAQSSVEEGGRGNGVYRLNNYGESAPDSAVLKDYRRQGAGKTVWQSTEGVWARALKKAT